MADDGISTVKAWLTAIDQRRFKDAQALLDEGWVDYGPGDFVVTREAFLAGAEVRFGGSDLRLTIHNQVAADDYVATQLSWVSGLERFDVLRLDLVRNGKVSTSCFTTGADLG
jgi:hypothetical protein